MFALLALALAQEAPSAAVLGPVAPPSVAPEEEVPLRLVLVPGIGLGASPDAEVHGASLGVVSHAASLEGFDGELVGSWVDGVMDGFQASIAYNVAGEVRGVQSSCGANWARGDVAMGQLSCGANLAEGRVKGVQASAGLNVAAGGLDGAQLSSGLNVMGGEGSGFQGSAGLNVADRLDGVQAAPVNVARELDGLQLGVLNVGGDVKGLQLGVVNIAKTSDVSIAPLNFIGDGLHRVDVWASESSVGNVGFKLGSKQVYTLLGAGWVGLEQSWWTFGGGFGVHLGQKLVWLEVDDSVWGLANGVRLAPGLHNKLRAQMGLKLHEHLQPFAGVSMNHWIGTGQVWPTSVELPTRITPDRRIAAWPGVHVGISF